MSSDRSSHWYSFLEQESLAPNGLLCFYDVQKSREVARCCTALVEGLPALLEDAWRDDDFLWIEKKFLQTAGGSCT
ncbi:MAG: hypothetical protein QME75_15810 [Deltaproteobacteria bacterium]|nr:hypothetical protein [Deltaproteobacteria bacterium]